MSSNMKKGLIIGLVVTLAFCGVCSTLGLIGSMFGDELGITTPVSVASTVAPKVFFTPAPAMTPVPEKSEYELQLVWADKFLGWSKPCADSLGVVSEYVQRPDAQIDVTLSYLDEVRLYCVEGEREVQAYYNEHPDELPDSLKLIQDEADLYAEDMDMAMTYAYSGFKNQDVDDLGTSIEYMGKAGEHMDNMNTLLGQLENTSDG